jgi:hypothetical protein
MQQHFESKTVMGLLTLLVAMFVLSYTGHLDANAVEVLKWLGVSFMSVRGAANVAENLPGGKKDV